MLSGTARLQFDMRGIPDFSSPIGDALRASAVAYWKMDEPSGIRADKSNHGKSLEDIGNVLGVGGKIVNSAELTSNAKILRRINDNFLQSFGLKTITVCAWVKKESFSPTDTDHTLFFSYSSASTDVDYFCGIYSAANPNDNGFYIDLFNEGIEIAFLQHSLIPVVGTYYFTEFYIDSVNQRVGVSVNASLETTAFYGSPSATSDVVDVFGVGNQTNSQKNPASHTFNGQVDEVAVFNRLITQTERDYLYNSGAGRSLYP